MDNKTSKKVEKEEPKKSIISIRDLVTGLAVLAIAWLATTVIQQGNKLSALEERVNSLNEIVKLKTPGTPGPGIDGNIDSVVSSIKNAEKELIDLVKKIQTKYVKLSTGTYDYNSFTDIDLDNFHKRDVPAEIEKNLLTDTKFLSLVITIKRLQPEQWGSIKSQVLKTYRPSFAEVGGVKSDGSAQTVAGQIAEKEIVEKIIEVMSAIKSKDEKEIYKMID